jgi:SAM-dependent methyltransferase
MNPEEYAVMFREEQRHWWYCGMRRITVTLLDRWRAPGSALRVLDAGCGTGAAMTSYLAGYGEVTGLDAGEEAVRFCLRRGARRVIRASVIRLPFRDSSFDLVASLDVLYEQGVPDDLAAMREIARVLAPQGLALLRLPAYDWLRGRHDAAVHSRRRYTRGEVIALLRRSGLDPLHTSYANMFLFPIAAAKRLAERLLPAGRVRSDLTLGTGPFNGVLAAILKAEAPLVVRTGLPFGLSVFAIGRKAPSS